MSDPWVLATQAWLNSTYGSHSQWVAVPETGQTGWPTMGGLTRALQIELGIANLSETFGPTTMAQLTQQYGDIGVGVGPNSNVVRIIQGGGYCKGFNTSDGQLTGNFDAQVAGAVSSMRTNLGLASSPATLTPKMFKGLLSMDAWRLVLGGAAEIREVQQALNARYVGYSGYELCSTDGLYNRTVQERFVYAIQYEGGVAGANGNFGPGTQAVVRANGVFGLGYTDTSKYWCHLFQAGMRFNGYTSTPFNGVFDAATQTQMRAFQTFIAMAKTSGTDFATWASLIVSCGDPLRPATGADASDSITPSRLNTLMTKGYTHFGRYLVNTMGRPAPWGTDLDKCLRWDELGVIFQHGGRVWPIFQTGGADPDHFTYRRGYEVSEEAANAAWAYRIPANTIIYFAVDFDVLDHQIDDGIIPYFKAITENISRWGLSSYRVGIYAPRHVCQRVADAGCSVSSFVSDMSTGFSGNKGYTMPTNWAFDQIHELDEGTGAGKIRIDRNVVSGRDQGVNSLAAPHGVGTDPLIPAAKFDQFELAWYSWMTDHPQNVIPAIIVARRDLTKAMVKKHDAYITAQAANFGVPKAMALTPLIWEYSVINPSDEIADQLVGLYYAALEAGLAPPPGSRSDSSTGVCQMFAETCIETRNWAKARGLISGAPLDANRWQDMWDVWRKLHTQEEYAIQSALLYYMYNAEKWSGIPPTEIRKMTPSQVAQTCMAYNGDMLNPELEPMKYGREKAQLYYLICKWEETFK